MATTTEAVITRIPIPSVVRRNTLLLAVAQGIAWLAAQTLVTLGGTVAFALTGDTHVVGVPLTIFGVASSLAAPVAGNLMDRLGRRPPLMLGQALIGLGGLAAGLSVLGGSFAAFAASMALVGMGTGTTGLTRSAAADMYPVSRRAEGMSVVITAAAVGAIGGPLLLGALVGWAKTANANPNALPWLCLPGVALIGLVSLWAIRIDPRDIGARLEQYYPGEAPQAMAGGAPARSLVTLLRQYPVIVAVAVTAFVQAGMVMFMATAPLNLKLHGHEDAVYGVISGHFLGMLSLSFFIGRLTDRLGRRTIILAGALVFIAGALTTPLFQNPLYVGASLFMVGLGWCLCYVAGNAVLADMTGPRERGRTMGANDLVVGLINSAAAFLAGLFYGGGGYLTVGILSSLLVLAPVVLALRLREPEPGVYATDKGARPA